MKRGKNAYFYTTGTMTNLNEENTIKVMPITPWKVPVFVGDEPVAAGFFMLKNFYEKTNQIECVFRFNI